MPIFIEPMSRTGKIFPVLLIALLICPAVFPDIGHTDVLPSNPNTLQTLTTHDCGARERHKDITHVCQACYRAANSTAKIPSTSIASSTVAQTVVRILLVPFRSKDYFCSCPKRGPPIS